MEPLTLEDYRIRIGGLVFFDIGQGHALIGMVTKLDGSDPSQVQVHIMHPTGRIRIRNLMHDLEVGKIYAVPDVDENAILEGCPAWQKIIESLDSST